ncbi:hypothetical protein ACTA71_010753 [Dictyostelium dimigraforme]
MIDFKKKFSNDIYAKLLFCGNSVEGDEGTIYLENHLIPFIDLKTTYSSQLLGEIHFIRTNKIRIPRTDRDLNLEFKNSGSVQPLGICKEGREYSYNKFTNRNVKGPNAILIECFIKSQNQEKIYLRHFIGDESLNENVPLSSITVKDALNNESSKGEEFSGLIGSNQINLISSSPESPLYEDPNPIESPLYDNDPEF